MYNKKWTAGLYLLPALVLVTVFIYVAIGLNFYYSLFRWSTYTEKVWVGLSNYVRMFQDQNFWTALTNNLFLPSHRWCARWASRWSWPRYWNRNG